MNFVIRYQAKQVIAALGRLEFALSGPGLAQAIQMIMTTPARESTMARFADEGDASSGKWLPLTQRTIDIRQSEGFGPGPINVRTGEMRAWATGGDVGVKAQGPAFAHLTYPHSPPGGELERKVSVAQSGDGDRTPARPILSWTDSDLEALMIGLAGWIEGVV